MKRIMLTVAYDGTGYSGFQVQDNAPTIEGELNRCLGELLQEEIKVIGGSRTDAGVHALCNVAVFDTAARMPGAKISYALNQRLPENIRVRKSQEVASDFHPRHCESRKTYEYRILNAEFPIPTKRLYAYFTYVPLNADRMQEAAAYLVGEHDFKSFCSAGSQVESTIRTIYSAEVQRKDDEIIIRVTGNGFLYNMVRILVGTLLEIGNKKRPADDIPRVLAAKDRQEVRTTAPASGLYLQHVFYEDVPKKYRLDLKKD